MRGCGKRGEREGGEPRHTTRCARPGSTVIYVSISKRGGCV